MWFKPHIEVVEKWNSTEADVCLSQMTDVILNHL